VRRYLGAIAKQEPTGSKTPEFVSTKINTESGYRGELSKAVIHEKI
jgi:hypothetical protein